MIWSSYTKSYFQMVTSPASSKFVKTSNSPLYTDTPETFKAALRLCYKVTMPVIFALLQIAATIPVTV